MNKDGIIESIGIVAATFLICMFLAIKNPLKLKGTYLALNVVPGVALMLSCFAQSIIVGVSAAIIFAAIVTFVAIVINKE
jgi:hypothetical protein